MKLNNRGWGLQVMLVFILILMIALVIIASIFNKYFKDLIVPINEKKYTQLEEKVVTAAKEYQQLYYKELDKEAVVTVATLKRDNFLDNIKDVEDNTNCTGYVILKQESKKIIYDAYINCSNYKTKNYLSKFDAK